MRSRKRLLLILVALWLLCLSGCRVRTGSTDAAVTAQETESDAVADASRMGEYLNESAVATKESTDVSDAVSETEEVRGRTRENPEADRKEYDENAQAEIVPGTDRFLQGEGDGNGAPLAREDADVSASQLRDTVEETALHTVPADEAEQLGVSEDAAAADSALTYYTVLLQERMGSLFECQRVNVYWETEMDHVTIHKSSPEHALILGAGAYDVSARLLPENLQVDNGWVARKNPQVIVKVVDSEVLGHGTQDSTTARSMCQSLLNRVGWQQVNAVRTKQVMLLSRELLASPALQTAVKVLLAKTAAPNLFADIKAEEVLSQLMEEETGLLPAGVYAWSPLW